MTTSNVHGAALDAGAVAGRDDRSKPERDAAEQAQAADTVARLTKKRDKAAERLADAEQALADAQARLGGGN